MKSQESDQRAIARRNLERHLGHAVGEITDWEGTIDTIMKRGSEPQRKAENVRNWRRRDRARKGIV